MQCKVGKVVGNLKALKHMLPDGVQWSAVVQHMPTLLLTDINKVPVLTDVVLLIV